MIYMYVLSSIYVYLTNVLLLLVVSWENNNLSLPESIIMSIVVKNKLISFGKFYKGVGNIT